jgi:hypothetical protein
MKAQSVLMESPPKRFGAGGSTEIKTRKQPGIWQVIWIVRYHLFGIAIILSVLSVGFYIAYLKLYSQDPPPFISVPSLPLNSDGSLLVQERSHTLISENGVCCRMGPIPSDPQLEITRIPFDFKPNYPNNSLRLDEIVFVLPVHVDANILNSNFFQFSRRHISSLVIVQDCPQTSGFYKEEFNKIKLHGRMNFHFKEVSTLFHSDQDNVYTVCTEAPGQGLSHKLKKGFQVALALFPQAKWIVKVDVDSYVFVENLIKLLTRFDFRKKYYLGEVLEFSEHQLAMFYNAGGGYAVSLGAAGDVDKCTVTISTREDVDMGFCMQANNVPALNIAGFYDGSLVKKYIPAHLNQKKVSDNHPRYQSALAADPIVVHKMSLEEAYLWDFIRFKEAWPNVDPKPEMFTRKL